MKLFSRSVANNSKVVEKVNLVDVTPTISSKGNLYLLVLYVLYVIKDGFKLEEGGGGGKKKKIIRKKKKKKLSLPKKKKKNKKNKKVKK